MERVTVLCLGLLAALAGAEDFPKPYRPPCTEREAVCSFTERPAVRTVGADRYEITFASKGNCDVAAGIVDGEGRVMRHLAAGVLGPNAPAPLQKNSLKQVLYWDGKDDLGQYLNDPGRFKVRVMLGLKPVFDKRLGDTNPKNLPGYVAGIAAGQEGVFLLVKGLGSHGGVTVRRFDHDGKYLAEVFPPRGDRPLQKYPGLGWVEYEAGKGALHGRDLEGAVAGDGWMLPAMNGKSIADIQPVLIGTRLYFTNAGVRRNSPTSLLHYIYTDGTTDEKGTAGRLFAAIGGKHCSHGYPRLAASPDGQRIFITNLLGKNESPPAPPVVLVCSTEGDETTTLFAGGPDKLGAGDTQFSDPAAIDCDGEGRVYVADRNNNRVQIFSPQGAYLKSIPLDRPKQILTPKKSGGIYVIHSARRSGKSIPCLTKFASFANPVEEYHVDGFNAAVWAMDSDAPKPRLWAAGTETLVSTPGVIAADRGVRIYEEHGKGLRLLEDFEESARRDGSESWFGGWSGQGPMGGKVDCDSVRNLVYYREDEHSGSGTRLVFDLKSGALLGEVLFNGAVDDIAFDKRGYLHAHFSPGFNVPGVGRFDSSRFDLYPRSRERAGGRAALPVKVYREVPYDYGEERQPKGGTAALNSEWKRILGSGWRGLLAVRDQPGACFFQNGIGVNMQGAIAVQTMISYVPKMGDLYAGHEFENGGGKMDAYNALIRETQERQKRGEEVFSIRREPGVPESGATIWTFDRTGELRVECAVIAGPLINSVQVDEDDQLYFTVNRTSLVDGRPFLAGRGGILGRDDKRSDPFTGTFCKTRGKAVRFLTNQAAVPMDEDRKPKRRPDLAGPGVGEECWVEGAEWLYAGSSPIKRTGCVCPTQRSHTDWYKRSYVPEMYRHSFAILDSAGNLIMRLGRYGNLDECPGAQGGAGVGSTEITLVAGRFINGTDDALVFSDRGERLTVLKLSYQAEAVAGIGGEREGRP